ncbi:hypothetical protein AnigIFM63604_009677 [Aspergillus niger]|uniref:Uncharacterized protein n=1 Tax=Aspergillus niger TaxID=5061 RepID=A0A9W6A307_ASPNG|nr:hypothetical protein AnigIFM63604_009677 [Aspergillus niger]
MSVRHGKGVVVEEPAKGNRNLHADRAARLPLLPPPDQPIRKMIFKLASWATTDQHCNSHSPLTPWKALAIACHSVVLDLAQVYFEIVYPM